MRSALLQSVVFLLIGAVITVAVAWTCAVTTDLRSSPTRLAQETWDMRWLVRRRDAFGAVHVYGEWVQDYNGPHFEPVGLRPAQLLPAWCSHEMLFDDVEARHGVHKWNIHGRGWPLIALHYGAPLWSDYRAADADIPTRGAIRTGLTPWAYDCKAHPRALPLRPVWSGFAIDSAIYGAALWVLCLGPVTGRRLFRWRRGACTRCGYDLRGTRGRCPECGIGYDRT
jgi:hypothetical protein